MARIKSNLASRVKKGKMTQEAADAVFARVKGALDYSDFTSVDMVRHLSCPSPQAFFIFVILRDRAHYTHVCFPV